MTYRHVLQQELDRRLGARPQYSLRAFSRSLGVDPANLSKVLLDKKALSLRTAEKIVERLHLKGEEAGAFLASVRAEKKTRALRRTPVLQSSAGDVSPTIDSDLLRVVGDWSELVVSELSQSIECSDIHRNATAVSGSVSKTPVRGGDIVILTVQAGFGSMCDWAWRTDHGQIYGRGLRVNFQPAEDFVGTAEVFFVVSFGGQAVAQKAFRIPVTRAAPRLVISSSRLIDSGTRRLLGYATRLPDCGWTALSVAGYPHRGLRYEGPPKCGRLDAKGGFCVDVPIDPSVDRVALHLVYQDRALPEDPEIHVDYLGEKSWLPLPVNGRDSLAYALDYGADPQVNADPQIAHLLSRFFKAPIPGTDQAGRFLRSYRTVDVAYIYDQALTVLALTHAGEEASARKILEALRHSQIQENADAVGAWYQSYIEDGTPFVSDRIRRPHEARHEKGVLPRSLPSDAAWVALAATSFAVKFGDRRYLSMAEHALDYLVRQRVFVQVNEVMSFGVRFEPEAAPLGKAPLSVILPVHHNVIAYAALRNYAQLIPDSKFGAHALEILRFIESMWDEDLKGFYSSYQAEIPAVNLGDAHMDSQSLAILALSHDEARLRKFRRGLDRIFESFFEPAGFMADRVGGIPGFFDWRPLNPALPHLSRQLVWAEGTLGVVLAMRMVERVFGRTLSFWRCGQEYTAKRFLTGMREIQDRFGGMPYATSNVVRDDFVSESSVSATSWLYFANHNLNPLASTLD